MRNARWLPVLSLLFVAAACSDEEATALQIRLVVDPQLNTEAQVMAAVGSVELLLDAPSGFSGVERAGASYGPLSALNADDDTALELSLRRQVSGGRLPRVRLLPGQNGDRGFKLTARGLAGETLAALGGLSSVAFADGETLDLLVPFNLRAAFLPPRVLVTLPRDGQTSAPTALTQIYVEFSKLVDQGSLVRHLRVIHEASGETVPGKVVVGVTTVVDAGEQERRSTASFVLGCALSAGGYRIEVGADVTDLQGNRLVQDDAAGGTFTAKFSLPGPTAPTACAGEPPPPTECTKPSDCDPDGTGQATCQLEKEGTGYCVPTVEGCDKLQCPENTVCQPIAPAGTPQAPDQPPPCPPECDQGCIQDLLSQGVPKEEAYDKCCQPTCGEPQPPAPTPSPGFTCVQDCRLVGFCAEGSYCEQATGACQPCDPNNPDGSNDPSQPGCTIPQPPQPPPPPDECKLQCEEFCNGQEQEKCQQCLQGCANQ